MEAQKNTVGYTESKDFRCLEDLQEAGSPKLGSLVSLDYCGSERCKPGYSFGPYVRENYVLHIITEGKGRLRIGDKTWLIEENQAFLLRPGTESVYQADWENPWSYCWVGFHGPRSENMVENMGFTREQNVIILKDARILSEMIERIMDYRELTYADSLKRTAILMFLMAEIIDHAGVLPQSQRLSEESYVNMALEEIISNYSHPLAIAEIANKIGINRSYLSIIFKKRVGMSPQQYLILFRLEKAASLLLSTDLAIRTVAADVGYSDPLTFSKAFKQKYGMSPSDYREHPPALLQTEEKGTYIGNRNL